MGRFLLMALLTACGNMVSGQQYTFTTLAGAAGASGGVDGNGVNARFLGPGGLALDKAGNIYVADTWNHAIRKVSPAGAVTAFAGALGTPGAGDGFRLAARFRYPYGVAVDSLDNIYVADTFNCTIRKIDAAGFVTTLAGSADGCGTANGIGSAARFYWPYGLAVDGAGNVLVADTYNHAIRKITPAGVVTTLAGLAGSEGNLNGSGGAARFRYPKGVAADPAGNLYVADTRNVAIRKISAAGLVTTLAGSVDTLRKWAQHGYDGEDAYREDCLAGLVACNAKSIIYLLQNASEGWHLWLGGNVVLGMYILGTPSPVDGHRTDDWVKRCNSLGISTQIPVLFNSPDSFAGDFAQHDGYLQWFANSINWAPAGQFIVCMGLQVHRNQQISAAWTPDYVNQMAGRLKQLNGSRFKIAIHDTYPQCNTWGKGGNIDIIYLEPEGRSAAELTQVINDIVFQTGKAVEVRATESYDGIGTAARFTTPVGLAADKQGNLYVADAGAHTVRKIDPSGLVSTLAGAAANAGSADGLNTLARFNQPSGLALDEFGNLYLVDTLNHTVRKGWLWVYLVVKAFPSSGGSVEGGGLAFAGSQRQLSAHAGQGWSFAGWHDGVVGDTRLVTVAADRALYIARFSNPTNPPLGVLLQAGNGGMAGKWTLDDDDRPAFWQSVVGQMGAGWVLRAIDRNRILLQQGDGGMIGLWDLENGMPVRWWQVSAPLPGWIARDLDGNRILLQAGEGGMIGMWMLGADNSPALWKFCSGPLAGLNARALHGDRILLQFGTGSVIGYWKLDAQDKVVEWLPINAILPPGWVVRSHTRDYMLVQAGDGGMAGVWWLDADGLPIWWNSITGPLPGWVLRGITQP